MVSASSCGEVIFVLKLKENSFFQVGFRTSINTYHVTRIANIFLVSSFFFKEGIFNKKIFVYLVLFLVSLVIKMAD